MDRHQLNEAIKQIKLAHEILLDRLLYPETSSNSYFAKIDKALRSAIQELEACGVVSSGGVQANQSITADWVNCPERGPLTRDEISNRIQRLRCAAESSRGPYIRDSLKAPYLYMSEAYDSAADVLQARLDAINGRTNDR